MMARSVGLVLLVLPAASVVARRCSRPAATPPRRRRRWSTCRSMRPSQLKRLLDTHLDLARLVRVASGEANEPISESELRRLENATPAQARALARHRGLHGRAGAHTAPGQCRCRRAAGSAPAGARDGRARCAHGGQRGVDCKSVARSATKRPAATTLRNRWSVMASRLDAAGRCSRSPTPTWRDAKNNALARLRAVGYSAAVWQQHRAACRRRQRTCRLALSRDSGPLFHTGEIVIEGLERQDEAACATWPTSPRVRPSPSSALLDFQERLQGTGLFEGVSVTQDADPQRADAATINVRVREHRCSRPRRRRHQRQQRARGFRSSTCTAASAASAQHCATSSRWARKRRPVGGRAVVAYARGCTATCSAARSSASSPTPTSSPRRACAWAAPTTDAASDRLWFVRSNGARASVRHQHRGQRLGKTSTPARPRSTSTAPGAMSTASCCRRAATASRCESGVGQVRQRRRAAAQCARRAAPSAACTRACNGGSRSASDWYAPGAPRSRPGVRARRGQRARRRSAFAPAATTRCAAMPTVR